MSSKVGPNVKVQEPGGTNHRPWLLPDRRLSLNPTRMAVTVNRLAKPLSG
jgi:hypothetical protein